MRTSPRQHIGIRDLEGATGGSSARAILAADTHETLADKLPVAPIILL